MVLLTRGHHRGLPDAPLTGGIDAAMATVAATAACGAARRRLRAAVADLDRAVRAGPSRAVPPGCHCAGATTTTATAQP